LENYKLPASKLWLCFIEIVTEKCPAVFILMAIDAEIFPIGTVWGIVQGVAVFMVHREELPVSLGEFPAALGANHPMNLQGALPVIGGFHGGQSSKLIFGLRISEI
jgi:hypothetical protein